MLLSKIKLQRYEPFARQHSDTIDSEDGFTLIADERRFIWVIDTKSGKEWGLPFEAARNWERSKGDQQVTVAHADVLPIRVRQARISEEAMTAHNMDEAQLIDTKGYEMVMFGTSFFVVDKARDREIPLAFADLEYVEIYPGQREKFTPLIPAVRPQPSTKAKKHA